MREILAHSLERPGWRVVAAEAGAAALDHIVVNGLPDLVLLDMNMPIMNGWQFAAELRARDLWRVPVVVITAAHDAARSASEVGASGFIGKPFDQRTLIETIERLLRPGHIAS